MNKRIIFMGTPAFAVASLNALVKAGMNVVAVVTAPDKPAGRGRQLRASAMKERALELGLPVLQPTNLKDPAFHAQLDAHDAALYVVVAFRMLPAVVWQRPPLGTINLHASLLPDYRGAAPINWAIINGETRTGATTFLINAAIDTGDLLLREVVEIKPQDNAGTLHDKLMHTGAALLVRTVKDLMDGTADPIPQETFVGMETRPAPKLTPENCRIDWRKPAQRVNDLVRGLSPFPGAWTQWTEKGRKPVHMKVLAAQVVHHPGAMEPGRVEVDNGKLLVHCGKHMLQVEELQMEGKKAMPITDFLNGLQRREGITLQ